MYQYMSDETLAKEYLALQKAALNPMFGRNAKQAANEIVAILHGRGIYEIANMFGPIPVSKFDSIA